MWVRWNHVGIQIWSFMLFLSVSVPPLPITQATFRMCIYGKLTLMVGVDCSSSPKLFFLGAIAIAPPDMVISLLQKG